MQNFPIEDVYARLDQIAPQAMLPQTSVGEFQAAVQSDGKAIKVSFRIANVDALASIQLFRNTTGDLGSAKLINSWRSPFSADQKLEQLDTDTSIQGSTQNIYYWLILVNFTQASSKTVGPAKVNYSWDQVLPEAMLGFAASKSAASAGAQSINIQVIPPAGEVRWASTKIYAQGYLANPGWTAVAQSSDLAFRFKLQQTGEVITLKAIAVSPLGKEAATGPTVAITLNGLASVPAKLLNCGAVETTAGVQVGFIPGLEPDVTQWNMYRNARGGGFGSATNIGTVLNTGLNRYTFLDNTGLAGVFEWYVVAVNGTGAGPNSDAFWQTVANTSADLPPNSTSNSTNFATVDSIDAGTSATIRIYGTGGVGSSWTRTAGYGNETYPSATITGKNYAMAYWVMFDRIGQQYVVTTSYPATMPDYYVWVGKVTTVNAGGGGGTGGGGGGSGGGGGCTEVGTELFVEDEARIELLANSEWIDIYLQREDADPLRMHPDTLVAVFVKASEIKTLNVPARIEYGDDGRWVEPFFVGETVRPSFKQSLKTKSGTYKAGKHKVRLHNNKIAQLP